MFYTSSDQSFDDFLSSHNLKKYYAYSTSKDGRENFSTEISNTSKYIGVCIATSDSIKPTDYAKYNWTPIMNKNKIEHICYMSLGDLICNKGDTFTLDKQTMIAYTSDKSVCKLQLLKAGTYIASDSLFGVDISYGNPKYIYKVSSVNQKFRDKFYGIYYDLSKDINYTVPYYYPSGEDENKLMYTIEVLSGNANLSKFTYLKIDENITKIESTGLNVFFLRGFTNPQVIFSNHYNTYSTPNLINPLVYDISNRGYNDCVLVILGFDALSVDSNLLNALKQYGYGGDKRLYEVKKEAKSFAFIGQKGIPEGYAYYTMDYEKIKANVKFGFLEENENSNEKNIFFNK